METGQVLPARCGSNACGYCLRLNAVRRAAAVAHSAPERALLLTQAGEDWQTVRRRMNRVVEYLRRDEIDPGEMVWHVEPNPAGTGHHVHAWQHGPYIPQAALSRAAERAGMGEFARISRVRSEMGAGAYGLKGVIAAGYGLKGIAESSETYLRENGGRLTHHSRGYFRDGRGGPVLAVREAERAAYGGRAGSWRLMAEWNSRTCPEPPTGASSRAAVSPSSSAPSDPSPRIF